MLSAAAVLFVALPWWVASRPAPALEAAAPVVAIIDVQKVLRESTAVRSLAQTIGIQRDAYQKELRNKEKALRNADRELMRQRTILAAEAFAKKRAELEQKVATLQREAREQKRRLDGLFGNGMAQVQNALAEIAKEIAEERGLDLVLSKATVVLVKPKFEITTEAVKRLNARLSEVTLPAAQN
ncbi:MAG: OmpH family outer membrane protein [Kiloniellaceae bacterium]